MAESTSTQKIIVIDDEQAMIDLIKNSLVGHAYEILGANDGPSGLELIAKERPDLVLLDLMMPGMHGWDVFQEMKKRDTARDIPVIVVTAKSQDIEKVFGLHVAKVQAYLTKPFSPAELVETIDSVL